MLIHSLLVGIGGFFGAMARFAINNVFKERHSFPIGTMVVNLVGAFLLGIVAGSTLGNSLFLLIGVGFLGAFTTFSTLSLDLVKLWNNKQWKYMIIYVSTTYLGGIILAFIGFLVDWKFL